MAVRSREGNPRARPRRDAFTVEAIAQLTAFVKGGGEMLFGTDVGYMRDFDPADEYTLMTRAGMTPMQILASLTTAPAARFQNATEARAASRSDTRRT